MTRREFAAMAAAGILGGCAERKAQVGSVVTSLMAPISDNAFLEDVARRAFLYFWEQGDPANGLVRDRSLADGSKPPTTDRYSASIAATGFGLSAMAIAADHKWMDENQLRDRVYNTLHFFAYQAPGKNGFFYHWLDLATGERVRSSEVSSIDSALLMAGVLTARERWAADPDIVELANLIYRKMDFDWLLDKRGLLSHGWRPEMGMLKSNWDTYSEHMILYLLAIGSPTHPIPASSWYSWSRPKVTYNEYTFVSDGPLFTQQYSHAWVDFRGLRDRPPSDINWFQNAITATEAHRQFCISLKDKFPDYGPQLWGITASDSVGGYRIWGGPPADKNIDGTVVPCAAGGSLMLTPQVSINTLRYMRNQFGNRIFGRYGFTDAFNPVRNWVDPEIIGIDQGIILLSAVNARNEGVWKWFMRAEEIRDAMQKIGFERDSPHQPALANARVRKS